MSMIPNLSGFSDLLGDLESGRISAIEYGDPEHPAGSLSLLRIRYIQTPGGMQYRIKFLHNGMEGSGIYLPSTDGVQELRDHLLCYIDRYHQKPAMSRTSVSGHLGDLLRAHIKRDAKLSLFGIAK